MIAIIVALLLSLPQWHADRLTEDERIALVLPVAMAIATSAATEEERLFLAAQTWHETRLASYVLEERCAEGPPGARCDEGAATGPWQVHRWCAGAWVAESSRTERFTAGAQCALQLYRWGRRECGTAAGGFAYQRHAGECSPAWALRRVETMRRLAR